MRAYDLPKILLIPDSALCRRVMKSLATEFDCVSVLHASALAQAMHFHQPDAVILWPAPKGFDLQQALLSIADDAPPLFVLTQSLDAATLIAVAKARSATLVSPEDMVQLPQILHQALAQQASQRRQQQQLAMLSHTATALWRCDFRLPDWPVQDANPALATLTGWPLEAILGLSSQHLPWDVEEQTLNALRQAHQENRSLSTTVQGQHRDSLHQWHARLDITLLRHTDGIPEQAVLSMTDITQTQQQLAKLEASRQQDSLTGLPNRVRLRDHLQQAIYLAERRGGVVAVIHMDLDNFKVINTTFGHEVGEQILAQSAKRLQTCLRPDDLLTSLGGQEFVLVMKDTVARQDTLAVLQQLQQAMADSFQINDQQIILSVSLGVSFYPDDGHEPTELLNHADAALHRAKELGRNHIQYYTRDLNIHIQERLLLEQSLHQALQRREFFLQYQPQLGLHSQRVEGVEALIRWQHPTLGRVSPDRFVGLAEEIGLIHTIGEWVLREACRQTRAWQLAGHPELRVAVNLSARQFQGRNLLRSVAKALSDSGLPARTLELEITESTLMVDAQEAVIILRGLKALGVKIAIDDFGTGYSSLSYLRRFPMDRLKIDRTFIGDLDNNTDDAVIVQTIISLGHNLGLQVIAEGVENASQLGFLQGQHCDELQGYWLSPPLDADALRAWLLAPLPAVVQHAFASDTQHHDAQKSQDATAQLQQQVQKLTQIEQSLHREHGLLRALLDHLPDHVYAKDIHGRFIVANQRAVEFLGAASEEALIGCTDFDFFDLSRAEQRFDEEQTLLASTDHFTDREEQVIDRATGERRWLYCIKAPFFDTNGQILGLVGVNRDVTERQQLLKRIEISLAQRERQLWVAGQVAQMITDGVDLSTIARRAVTLICEGTSAVYSELFRTTANGLTLLSGHGQLGRRLMQQNHQETWRDGIAGEAAMLACPVHRTRLQGHDAPRLATLNGQVRGHYAVPLRRNIQDGGVQAQALRYFLDEAVDGMLVCVINPDTVAPICREALWQGVPVVCQSEDLGETLRSAFIGVEEYRCGYLLGEQAGQWANQHIPAGQRLAVALFNYRLLPQVIERENGMLDGLRASFQGPIDVVANETSADPLTSIGIAERWLEDFPQLRMILGINDGSALGALRALIAQGKNDPTAFFLGGIDAIDEALVALASRGAFQATVEYPARSVGITAVRTLAAAIANRPYDRRFIIPSQVIHRENLDHYLRQREIQPTPLPQEPWLKELRGRRLGISVMNLSNPFFQSLVQAAQNEAQRLGMQILVNDPGPVLGVLSTFTNNPQGPDREERLGLEGVAQQLAVALELERWRQEDAQP